MIRTPTLKEFFDKMQFGGYEIYSDASKPYRLNIIGWRNKEGKLDAFDDYVAVYRVLPNHKWEVRYYRASTRPGKGPLVKPLNPKGTAILKPGQYLNAYELGSYHGYPALKQVAPVTVFRDNTLDENFDERSEETGVFGIHIHRAGFLSKLVGNWSAGCQVFQNRKDFDEFIGLCEVAKTSHGNRFTYTLLEF